MIQLVLLKAEPPIVSGVPCILTSFNSLQSLKAAYPIFLTLLGISILSILHSLNASDSIFSKFSGKFTSLRFVQFLKALLPTHIRLFGKSILSNILLSIKASSDITLTPSSTFTFVFIFLCFISTLPI